MPLEDQEGEVKGRPPDIKQGLFHRGEDNIHLNGPPSIFSASFKALSVVEIMGSNVNVLFLPHCRKAKSISCLGFAKLASIGHHECFECWSNQTCADLI